MGDGDFPEGQPPHEASADEAVGNEEAGLPRRCAPRNDGEDGEERICSGKHRPLQVSRDGKRKLFKKARKAFLEWFAATGNVVWSAEKVGFSDKTVWRHRMNDPRFAEAFDRRSSRA